MDFFSFFKKQETKSTFDPNDVIKYKLFLDYFEKERFGTNLPVLTMFSYLPIKDRVVILQILSQKDICNPYIYDKLSLALLKNNRKNDALSVLRNAYKDKYIDKESYLNLNDKIISLAVTFEAENSEAGKRALALIGYQKPKTVYTYNEIPSILSSYISQCSEFYYTLSQFCKQN